MMGIGSAAVSRAVALACPSLTHNRNFVDFLCVGGISHAGK
jgi:hypothetical protein